MSGSSADSRPVPAMQAPATQAPVTPAAAQDPAAAEARPDLPPAALRALAEAEERRRQARRAEAPPEFGGRDGPDPMRFGDYEKDGRAVDF